MRARPEKVLGEHAPNRGEQTARTPSPSHQGGARELFGAVAHWLTLCLKLGHSLLALRKHQGWWRDFDSKLRRELVSEGSEQWRWARRRKER